MQKREKHASDKVYASVPDMFWYKAKSVFPATQQRLRAEATQHTKRTDLKPSKQTSAEWMRASNRKVKAKTVDVDDF